MLRTDLARRDTANDQATDLLRQQAGHPLRFTLLGPLEILHHGRDCAPTAPKMLQLLAMLLLRAGRVVQSDALVEELWADAPPPSVRTTLQTYVYQVRKLIEREGIALDADRLLLTKAPGYQLAIDPMQVDVFVFRQLCHQGRQALHEQRHQEAASTLRAALSLWSGPPIANVECGPRLTADAVELYEQKRNAHHLRIQAEMAAGMHRELIGELKALVTDNPLDEGLHAQLIQVLDRSGRRSEALEAYRSLRKTLNTELGLEPSSELQQLHHELLSAGVPVR
ncbi:AfsR/SARP family transcriptional regulator [Haloechinothrix sp. LS1_15]|uniref:AfsR/SARP family transcriptional regulator n=1 Tax=Haloechinothrix sp. LS1_15 TaxID=2652248 RepID=UPI00294883CC|nr:AfsR/SARP family transcriptional regulator [Haloechinothrix sp. LS1_15]MDV6011616.1 AfsR/SARP family transcriptional regulator [Haloechinothrix sp. LS1_15]